MVGCYPTLLIYLRILPTSLVLTSLSLTQATNHLTQPPANTLTIFKIDLHPTSTSKIPRNHPTQHTTHTTQPQRKNLPRRLRVASHEGHQIRAQRQLPSLRQLATLAFPQLWRFIAGGDDTQARKWEDMGTDMGHDAVSGLAKYTFSN